MGLCCCCWCKKSKSAKQQEHHPYTSYRINNNLQTLITDSVPVENTKIDEEYIKSRQEKKQQQNSTRNSKENKKLTKSSSNY